MAFIDDPYRMTHPQRCPGRPHCGQCMDEYRIEQGRIARELEEQRKYSVLPELVEQCRKNGLASLTIDNITIVLADPKPAPREIPAAKPAVRELSEEERVLERTKREAAEKSDELRNLLWSSGIDPSALEITERKE